MGNNARHLIAYLAMPSMGAVLHALNIRLLPEQLVDTTRHAGNEVVTSSQRARGVQVAAATSEELRHVIVHRRGRRRDQDGLEAVEHIKGVQTSPPCSTPSPRSSTGRRPRRELHLLDGCPP